MRVLFSLCGAVALFVSLNARASDISDDTHIIDISPKSLQIRVASAAKLNMALNSYRPLFSSGVAPNDARFIELWPHLKIVFLDGRLYSTSQSSELDFQRQHQNALLTYIVLRKHFAEMSQVRLVQQDEVLVPEAIEVKNDSRRSIVLTFVNRDFSLQFSDFLDAHFGEIKQTLKGVLSFSVVQ